MILACFEHDFVVSYLIILLALAGAAGAGGGVA